MLINQQKGEKESGEPTEEDLEIIEQVVESDLRYELPHRGSWNGIHED